LFVCATHHLTTTGAGQLILISCYVFAAYEAGRPCFEDTRIYAFYILGILSQIGYTLTKTYFARFYRTYHYWRVVLERATPLGYSYSPRRPNTLGGWNYGFASYCPSW
jgi:hypothetical protein